MYFIECVENISNFVSNFVIKSIYCCYFNIYDILIPFSNV